MNIRHVSQGTCFSLGPLLGGLLYEFGFGPKRERLVFFLATFLRRRDTLRRCAKSSLEDPIRRANETELQLSPPQ